MRSPSRRMESITAAAAWWVPLPFQPVLPAQSTQLLSCSASSVFPACPAQKPSPRKELQVITFYLLCSNLTDHLVVYFGLNPQAFESHGLGGYVAGKCHWSHSYLRGSKLLHGKGINYVPVSWRTKFIVSGWIYANYNWAKHSRYHEAITTSILGLVTHLSTQLC